MRVQSILRDLSLVFAAWLASCSLAAATERDVLYARWPLQFEANQGQTRDEVQFLARGPGYGVYLAASEAMLVLSPGATPEQQSPRGACTQKGTSAQSRVLRMSLVGGAKAPPANGLDEQAGKANYFIGDDPSKWRTHIPTYAKVRYDSVYPDIDVVYYGNQRQLEYDFVLAAGADPKQIELEFDGADRVEIAANGDLVLHACGREIRQSKPVAYQDAAGRHEVASRYVRKAKNRIGFAVGAYDRSHPLVIDPMVLTYASYLGGADFDGATAVAVDASGAAYITGWTGSTNLPVNAGAFDATFNGGGGMDIRPVDAFVAKFNARRLARLRHVSRYYLERIWQWNRGGYSRQRLRNRLHGRT